MKPITVEWVAKAEEDYVAAPYLSRKRKSSIPDIVCFHCQQRTEKYLKALLVEAEVRFPKTHDLLALLKLVATVVPFLASFHERLERLNDYAVEFRYPGDESTKRRSRNRSRQLSCCAKGNTENSRGGRAAVGTNESSYQGEAGAVQGGAQKEGAWLSVLTVFRGNDRDPSTCSG